MDLFAENSWNFGTTVTLANYTNRYTYRKKNMAVPEQNCLIVFFRSESVNSSFAKKGEHSRFNDICLIKFQILITWQPKRMGRKWRVRDTGNE